MPIKFEKVMSREVPLVLVEAWSKCFTEHLPRIFGFSWPAPIFIYRHGTVESWRPVKHFYGVLPKRVSQWAKSQAHIKQLLALFKDYHACSAAIKRMNRRRIDSITFCQAINGISAATSLFMRGCTGLIPAYWCVEWNAIAKSKKQPQMFSPAILRAANKLRKDDTLMDDTAEVVDKYLKRIAYLKHWQSGMAYCMMQAELTCGAHEDAKLRLNAIQNRAAGYMYARDRLYSIGQMPAVLKKFGYVLEEKKINNTAMVSGMIANKGRVSGRVAVVFARADMRKVRAGDVIVAPMTTPWYLPIMKKASAFVTDEGGIISHAAIIAREMNKPCIVGTKIATEVLKDGDLVEVDADKGIVKKIKK